VIIGGPAPGRPAPGTPPEISACFLNRCGSQFSALPLKRVHCHPPNGPTRIVTLRKLVWRTVRIGGGRVTFPQISQLCLTLCHDYLTVEISASMFRGGALAAVLNQRCHRCVISDAPRVAV
jgi:hypothetical protein